MTRRGIFITFEGGEGTGKSTQIERLRDRLAASGREVVVTREPGGTPLAEAVRRILLDPDQRPDGLVELFLLEAARRDHVERVIRPALARGAVVLCDRYADSSTVYQGMVRGVGVDTVLSLNRLATGGLEPDLTVVLDVELNEAMGRVEDRNSRRPAATSRIDDEPASFHRRVREGYLELARRFPERVRVVDATADRESVFKRVLEVLPEELR
jgi:dTMP kinase